MPDTPALSAAFADRLGVREEECRRLIAPQQAQKRACWGPRMKPARVSITHLTQDVRHGLMLFRPPGSILQESVVVLDSLDSKKPQIPRLRFAALGMTKARGGHMPDPPALSATFADWKVAREEECRRLKPARDSKPRVTQDFRPGLMLFRPPGSILQESVVVLDSLDSKKPQIPRLRFPPRQAQNRRLPGTPVAALGMTKATEGHMPDTPALSAAFVGRRGAREEECRRLIAPQQAPFDLAQGRLQRRLLGAPHEAGSGFYNSPYPGPTPRASVVSPSGLRHCTWSITAHGSHSFENRE